MQPNSSCPSPGRQPGTKDTEDSVTNPPPVPAHHMPHNGALSCLPSPHCAFPGTCPTPARGGKQQTALAWGPSCSYLQSGLDAVLRNLQMSSPPPYSGNTEAQGGIGPGPTSPTVSHESEEKPWNHVWHSGPGPRSLRPQKRPRCI